VAIKREVFARVIEKNKGERDAMESGLEKVLWAGSKGKKAKLQRILRK